MTITTTTRPHDTYRHEAFFYRGDADFVATTAPFVKDGVAQGQPVMVAVATPRLSLLQSALGATADEVCFVDMTELGHNPARIIPGWRSFIDEHAGTGRPMRGVGEPIWAGRRRPEILESQFHEALLNLVIEPDTPLWLRCPYDLTALDDGIVEESMRSHPTIVGSDSYRGSPTYGGMHHARDMFSGTLAGPETPADERSFRAETLGATRRWVAALATLSGIDLERVADLTLAVGEVAANSVRYGGGGGSIRVWRSGDALVCEVSDRGHLEDVLVGRLPPSVTQVGGRGVWLANQLCDLVQLRSNRRGTTVRIYTWTRKPLEVAPVGNDEACPPLS
jgi:anti-sigma regulatory factor (Ser/Thr protein kinase)